MAHSRGALRGRFYRLAVGFVVIGLAAACGGGSSNSGSPSASGSTGTPQRGGTLTIDVPLSALDLNPFTCSCEQASEETMVQLYDQLVEFMPGNLTPQPGLAKSWKVSKDQKTFTFNLRPAQFSNGRPETSADVKYMLKRISAPTATLAVLYSVIKKIATPNAETVVVSLSQPTPNFVSYLGSPFASVVSKAVITKLGDKAFDLHPVGSGAFELSHWAQGREVDLTRNPHYWRTGQPYLDAVKLMYVPDDNTRMLNLLSGSVDAIDTPAFSDIAHLQSTPNVETVIRPSANVVTVNLNEKYAPLSEKVVRQALIYATPTQEIQKVAFAGQGQIMNVDIQKLTGWNPSVKPYPYDVAKAKQLMSQSSTPNGFALSLSIVTGDQALKTASEILQSSWAKIGVKVSVNQLDFGTLMSKWYGQNYQANMTLPNATASDVPVLDEFATIDFNSASSLHNLFSNYSNPAAARLAGQAIHATDPATQTQLFNKLQQITMADPESVPILWPPMLGAVRSTVHGFDYVALGWWRLEQAWLGH